ncbi:aminoglycoside phosphotransferase family protein [Candidatus Berkiella cookevillensis]|uniref:Aminoglycoside phosphotransferase family protein n=1 Tax=Candidatus Berkiella cookevillensis TaxID=437022 RepID=A0A0Q9YK97_9GAMM|nr:phosphotransferase [Candidatus Berkiella cookevillensis]MCS5709159.1 aminoglycoside phosphotransferase family protein [Candidatus Berkiella cookevillensis]
MQHQAVVIWCETVLKSKGYSLLGSIEPVRLMLWSKVYRILTSEGYIYIKQMTAPFAIEAKLIHYLVGRGLHALPKLIAYNEALLCFMMQDSGTTLRTILMQHYDIDIAIQGLVTYANIQQETSQSLEALFALGIPDWRLQYLPQHYHTLLSHDAWLLNDGLSMTELDNLKKLHSQFSELCEQLAYYKIPETIEHCDFQDNNLLLQQARVTISDWADAVVAHPFFSLHSFLQSARRNHGFAENSEIDSALKNAYLQMWTGFESNQRLLEVYDLSKVIHPIKFAISFYRITLCAQTDEDNIKVSEYKGTITEALRLFMKYAP